MRVAYYYHLAQRLPPDDSRSNPYGELLCRALERLGVEVEFALDLDESFLERNRDRIDLLHLNWPHFDYYHEDADLMRSRMRRFVARLELARALGYKLVWTAHNIYPHNRRHQAIDHECRVEICRLATAVIAHCPAARAEVERWFARRRALFVIPHGHFIDVYARKFTRSEARADLGVPADAFVYGFFGHMQAYKGLEELIEAFCGLGEPDAWLVAVGGGRPEYLERIRAIAGPAPRVVLRTFPRAPTEEFTRVLEAADIVTLPFTATMTSGTVMLALSWPRPVLAPALGCLPMTLAPAGGILYDPSAPGALPSALKEARRLDLEAAARAALEGVRRFDWDTIARATLEAYRA
jgi:glycosyltransferase involved in cell wall biosynthesis